MRKKIHLRSSIRGSFRASRIVIFIRSLSKFALFDKISIFCADLCQNFESMCDHIVEKFWHKDAKKGNFNKQMEFRKRSITLQALRREYGC